LSGDAEKILKQKDSKRIVIDDFAGMLITYLFIPYDIRFVVCGFFLFRMFDVLKIPPANKIEKCKGALGVVGDDVVAGVYANIVLQLTRILLNIIS
jgi:phosphatidylglycerophosphatase A